MFARKEEYQEQKAQFHDWYGETPERLGGAAKIAGIARPQQYLYVPTTPNEELTIGLEDVQDMKADGDVTYLLPCKAATLAASLLATGEVENVYKDDSFAELLGYRLAPNVFVLVCDVAMGELVAAVAVAANALLKADAARCCKYAEADEARDKRRRAAILEFVTASVAAKKEELRNAEETLESRRLDLSRSLIEVSRGLEQTRVVLDAWESKGATFAAEQRRSIDELLSYDSLRDVKFRDGSVVFVTKELGVRDKPPGTYRPFGEFEVSVDMSTSAVVVKNTNNHIRDGCGKIPHPHCGDTGNPCLGNIADAVREVVTSYDLLGLWQLLHGFLTSYNENDSWGKRYKYWNAINAETGEIVSSPGERQEYGVCARCGWAPETEEEAEDCLRECAGCGDTICDECSHYCDDDDEYYCSDCEGPYCEACDVTHAPGTAMLECEHCGTYVCEERAVWVDDVDGDGHCFCCEDHRDENVEDNYERFHAEEEGDE